MLTLLNGVSVVFNILIFHYYINFTYCYIISVYKFRNRVYLYLKAFWAVSLGPGDTSWVKPLHGGFASMKAYSLD